MYKKLLFTWNIRVNLRLRIAAWFNLYFLWLLCFVLYLKVLKMYSDTSPPPPQVTHFFVLQIFLLEGSFKVIWKANIVEFLDKIFLLNMPLNLTKINCITLKICSKADFMSKSQNIWQQIILLSKTVMQMICAWPKIWTLSGRLSLMRNVQLMKKIYIPCVPHKSNCKKNWFTWHETDRFLNNNCQDDCVRVCSVCV